MALGAVMLAMPPGNTGDSLMNQMFSRQQKAKPAAFAGLISRVPAMCGATDVLSNSR